MFAAPGLPIFCPPCVAPIPSERVEWEALRATCPRCDLMIILDGDLVPQRPVAGFPDRLLEMRPTEPAPPGGKVVVERDGRATRVRLGGLASLVSKRVRVLPGRVEIKPLFGRRFTVEMADVLGFVPIQHVAWSGQSPQRIADTTWRVHFVYRGQLLILFRLGTWRAAQHVAATLNEAVARAREPATAYRG